MQASMADAAAAAFAAVGVVRRGYAGAKRFWDTMMTTEDVIPTVLLSVPRLARRVFLKAKREFAPRSLSAKEHASMILVDVGAFDQHGAADAFLESKTFVTAPFRTEVLDRITAANKKCKSSFSSDAAIEALYLIGTRLGAMKTNCGLVAIVEGGAYEHAPGALMIPLLDVNSTLIPEGLSGLWYAIGLGMSCARYDDMLAAATESTLCDPKLVQRAAACIYFPHILQSVLRYAFDDGTGVPLPADPIAFPTIAMAGSAVVQRINGAIHQRTLAQERYQRDIWQLLTGLMGLGRGHAQLVLLVLTYVMGDRATTCKR